MFHDWENFFVTAGTAAATLAGLLFVVITLSVSLATTPAARGVHAFVTPLLVHFAAVLFLSLVLLIPWPSALPLGIILAMHGIAGMAYALYVMRLVRKLDFVSLDRHDWVAYAGAPAFANASLVAGAVGLILGMPFAPYVIAGAVLLLLFVGILDAWDLTLWIVSHREMAPNKTDVRPPG
jgi:hypothetical protein